MRIRGDVAGLVATGVGLLPGFVFPFVVSATRPASVTDALFLAMSVGVLLVSILGSVIETNTVAEARRHDWSTQLGGLGRYLSKVGLFALAALVAVGTPILWLYSQKIEARNEFLLAGVFFLILGWIGSIAGVYSGLLMARNVIYRPIMLQGLRASVPLLALLCIPGIGVLGLGIAFVVGELSRLVVMVVMSRGHYQLRGETELKSEGIVWQSLSRASANASPLTDRIFLGYAPVGSITTYELSDKLYFVANQVVQTAFVVRRMPGWVDLRGKGKSSLSRLRRDFFILCALAAGVSLALSLVLILAVNTLPLASSWAAATPWALILLLSFPLSIPQNMGSRLIVIMRKQRLLIALSLVTVLANLIFDAVFFVAVGAVGIIVATAVTRLVTATLYILVVGSMIRNGLPDE
jgi:O-antigen/teichoic acid export membrane protein